MTCWLNQFLSRSPSSSPVSFDEELEEVTSAVMVHCVVVVHVVYVSFLEIVVGVVVVVVVLVVCVLFVEIVVVVVVAAVVVVVAMVIVVVVFVGLSLNRERKISTNSEQGMRLPMLSQNWFQ